MVYLAPESPCQVLEKYLLGALDLVVEVLSPSTAKHDRDAKFRTYQQHGVREYWIVDPAQQTLEAWGLKEGIFHKLGTFAPKDIFQSGVLTQAPIALSDIFSA